MQPSERAKAAGAPVEVDISKLEPGQKLDVEWRGKVVWIVNRSKAMMDSLPGLRRQGRRPEIEQQAAARVRQKRRALPQGSSGSAGDGRDLHAPRMLADVQAGSLGHRRRFLLPVPRLEVRLRRRVFKGVPGADQSRDPAVQVSRQQHRRSSSATIAAAPEPGRHDKNEQALTWIDDRFPLTKLWEEQWGKYVAPKNFNFWYYFGSLAAFVLVIQIVSGIFLTMNYKPDATKAFESVEYIMRDVPWGWLIRYIHSTGASAFFVVVYLHMFRGTPVRLVPEAARADLDLRRDDLPRA
jgi:hypothetical protein